MTVINTPYRNFGGEPTIGRMASLALLMLAAATALGWKLYEIQVANPGRYVEYGDSQRVDRDVLPAERGSILDRNGLLLAGSAPRASITANPRLVGDAATTARALAPVLGVSAAEVGSALDRPDRFAYLARQVDAETAEAVVDLDLAGIYVIQEPSRTNPGGDDFARSVVGRASVDNIGVSGLELQYDDLLTGNPGDYVLERASNGALIPSGRREISPAVAGDSLVLTIDQTLQFTTERLLAQRVRDTGAQAGIAVVLDNRTGDILSMATVERDADTDQVAASGNNRAVTWAYEPGSIAKPLAFAGVLEAGVGQIDHSREVPWRTMVYDGEFTDATEHATTNWTMTDILQKSSNVGTILWAQELGAERLHDTYAAFGLGEATELGFVNETSGILRPLDDWSGTSLPTIAIGQGVSVTPLQMAQAYAIIANGGVRVSPRLVLGSQDRAGTFTAAASPGTERVISEGTAAALTEMLTAVVATGTGANAAIPGYSTAGKTGTAWKPQANGGYEDELGRRHFVASFAGFLPADDPEITIVIAIDEPTGSLESGGLAAAPLFAELSRYTLTHLRIAPSTGTAVSEQLNMRSETLEETEIATADIPPDGDGPDWPGG